MTNTTSVTTASNETTGSRARHYNDQGERLYALATGAWLPWEELVDFLYAQPEMVEAVAREDEARAAYDAASTAFTTGRDALNRYEIGYEEYHRLWTIKDARYALAEQARSHRAGVYVWLRGIHVTEVD